MVADHEAVPSSILRTEGVRPRERFALWREAMASTHDARLPDESDATRFSAYARGWNLGSALVIETRATAQILSRTTAAIRIDQVDHYIIRLQRGGRWRGEANGRRVDATTGRVMVLDMARTTSARGTAIENISVLLPRDAVDQLVRPFDMHGHVLHGGTAMLLRNHLVSLVETLPYIPRARASDVAQATLSLVAACLAPSQEAEARAAAPLALARLTEIRRYIDRHLNSPQLAPEAICKALGLSRSTLYAACESRGGVAAFIQRRRLDRIHALLADPHEHRSISELAYRHGFVSSAHFSRAFRAAFGYSPREARAEPGRHFDTGGPLPPDSTYRAWIRALAG